MPAKKRAKLEIPPEPDPPPAPAGNEKYYTLVEDALATILNTYQDLQPRDPLPEIAETKKDLAGFMAPFNPATYDAKYAAMPEDQFEYHCGINLLATSMTHSVTPFIPIIESRVQEAAEALEPGLAKFPVVVAASFPEASKMPKGAMLRLSPDEFAHAYIFKFAEIIKSNADGKTLNAWLRTILSFPCTFKRRDTTDSQYAEANSCRQDYLGKARLTTLTARQIVFIVFARPRIHGKGTHH